LNKFIKNRVSTVKTYDSGPLAQVFKTLISN
jgi:hypothetical protein